MKKLLIIVLLTISLKTVYVQKTVGIGAATPNPGAALEMVSSENKRGFLVSRLVTAQRRATDFDKWIKVGRSENATVFCYIN